MQAVCIDIINEEEIIMQRINRQGINENFDFIKIGIWDMLDFAKDVKIDIQRLNILAKDCSIDIFGESDVEKKCVGDILYEINLNSSDNFVVWDLGCIYKGDIKVVRTFPSYEINEATGELIVNQESLTKEAYVEALKSMIEETKNTGYNIRIVMEQIANKLIVFKIIRFDEFFYVRKGECFSPREGVAEVDDLLKIDGQTAFEAFEIHSLSSHTGDVEVKCKLSYQKYGEAEETIEICDRYHHIDNFTGAVYKIQQEVAKHNLEKISYENFGMDIYKMDELAAYIAMDYYTSGISKGVENWLNSEEELILGEKCCYDVLHSTDTILDYCKALNTFFKNESLDKIVRVYKELENNPDKDLLDIYHTVYEKRFDAYKENEVYLALIYDERLKEPNRNHACIVLLSEKEHYEKGKEILKSHRLPFRSFRDDEDLACEIYRRIREGNAKNTKFAVMLDNIYISDEDGKEYMHAWNDTIRTVKVVGKSQNGILLTEIYNVRRNN